jgi:outer membrane protein OmpA-like peptidoglycan-associated protein
MSLARFRSRIFVAFLFALVAGLCTAAWAQETQPKINIFGGYSWESPGQIGTPSTTVGKAVIPPGAPLEEVNTTNGWAGSLTYNFARHFGLTGEVSQHYGSRANLTSVMLGPRFFLRTEHIMPFGEVLFGLDRVTPKNVGTVNGSQLAAGGGFDLQFSKRVAWRIIQADYVRGFFGSGSALGVDHMSGVRLQTGLVIGFGYGAPPAPPTASCSVDPSAVLAGEPVAATINASGFNPKHTITYDFKSTGGKVTPKDTTATIDTTGLTPGSYTVTCTATDQKAKKNNTASATANFTINEPPKHPPVISCGANPTTVVSGGPINLSAQASSPDNRPLTYTWTPSAGRVTGTGENVVLDTAGVPPGPVTVGCVATDDRGLSANSSTTVNVQAPPPPPPPPAPAPGSAAAISQELHEKGRTLLPVHFDTAKATIRPDSEELLTNAAQVLQEDPNLFVFVDGYTDNVGGKAYNLALSKRRAAAVRTWLTQHGIAGNRLVARGFGMANPVGDNSTAEGRQLNRRVELVTMSEAEKVKAQTPPKIRRKR